MKGQPEPGITITEKGPNGWAAALLAGGIAAVGVILAVAIWQVSLGLSVGVAAVGIGIGAERLLNGAGWFVLMRKRGQAEEIAAAGQAKAQVIGARNSRALPPGDVIDREGGRA